MRIGSGSGVRVLGFIGNGFGGGVRRVQNGGFWCGFFWKRGLVFGGDGILRVKGECDVV